MRNFTLRSQFPDLGLPFIFPCRNVRSFPYTHRSTGEDQSANDIIVVGRYNQLLVSGRSTSFLAGDESRSDPDTYCPVPGANNCSLESHRRKGYTYDSAAARPRPSAIPPAATTMTGSPVSGLLAFLHRSTQAGIRIENGVSPVCPPPSPPCAQMMSTPRDNTN